MTMLIVFGLTFAAFALVITGMAVGVMMGRREISGSCGGLGNQAGGDGQPSCSLCSNPDAACRELRAAMEGQPTARSTEDAAFSQNTQAANSDCQLDCEAAGCSKEAIDACKGN